MSAENDYGTKLNQFVLGLKKWNCVPVPNPELRKQFRNKIESIWRKKDCLGVEEMELCPSNKFRAPETISEQN